MGSFIIFILCLVIGYAILNAIKIHMHNERERKSQLDGARKPARTEPVAEASRTKPVPKTTLPVADVAESNEKPSALSEFKRKQKETEAALKKVQAAQYSDKLPATAKAKKPSPGSVRVTVKQEGKTLSMSNDKNPHDGFGITIRVEDDGFLTVTETSGSPAPKPNPGRAALEARYADLEREEEEIARRLAFSAKAASQPQKPVKNKGVSKNNEPARWLKAGEAVTISGIEIKGGLIFVGHNLAPFQSSGDFAEKSKNDAALVNPSLAVTCPPSRYVPMDLSYYPKFGVLDPRTRWQYLQWLASDRTAQDSTEIGFAFLYFYGLERKAICENPTEEELRQIYAELMRLHKEYARLNYSFETYARRLIAWLHIQNNTILSLSDDQIVEMHLDEIIYFRAGNAISQGKPISPELAFMWAMTKHPGVAYERAPEEYKILFKILYQEKHGEGMKIKPNKKRFVLNYSPASPTISRPMPLLTDVPDPAMLSGPENSFSGLRETCRNELMAYGRTIKNESFQEQSPLYRLSTLPDKLIGHIKIDGADKALSELQNIAKLDGALSLDVLWGWLYQAEIVKPPVTKATLDRAHSLLFKLGYGVAPRQDLHKFKPKEGDSFYLYSLNDGPDASCDKAFDETVVSIWLGVSVAASDKDIHDKELQLLRHLIDGHNSLTPVQKRSLHAFLSWQIATPVAKNQISLKRVIQASDKDTKKSIGELLIKIAVADGNLLNTEIKELERLYKILGLDTSGLSSQVHGIAVSNATTGLPEPMQGADQGRSSTTPQGGGFALDEGVLARHKAETAEVQGMLGQIFASIEEQSEPEPETPAAPPVASTNSVFPGLDPVLAQILDQLLTREQWDADEFEDLCKPYGLMVGATVEAINEWAFDNVDDAIIDEDGEIYVQMDIAEEILKLKVGTE